MTAITFGYLIGLLLGHSLHSVCWSHMGLLTPCVAFSYFVNEWFVGIYNFGHAIFTQLLECHSFLFQIICFWI